MKSSVTVGLICAALMCIHCDGTEPENQKFTTALTWLENSLLSLPSFGSQIDVDTYLTTNTPDQDDDGDAAIFDLLNDVFDFECHRETADLELRYCPEDISEAASNEFSLETINGILARALLHFYTYYPDSLENESCESTGSSEEIIGSIEFSPETSQDFSLLSDDLWQCFDKKNGADDVQIFTMYNKAQDNTLYALTQFRLGQFDGQDNSDQIIEIYGRRENPNDTTYAIIAWNIVLYIDRTEANEQDQTLRLVLMLNPSSKNFVLKFANFERSADTTTPFDAKQEVIMLGRAGYDWEANSYFSGQYYLKTKTIDDENFYERLYCASNQSTPQLDADCSSIQDQGELFFDQANGYFSSGGIFTFLEMNSEDQTNLENFSTFFDQPNYITSNQLALQDDFPSNIVNNDDPDEE
ncbi:MAG: hypothetical protein KDD46_05980 [Bdellovibrionales bacterium]|nr:hypothetical protein [Bdellovibrionales bacterium]